MISQLQPYINIWEFRTESQGSLSLEEDSVTNHKCDTVYDYKSDRY